MASDCYAPDEPDQLINVPLSAPAGAEMSGIIGKVAKSPNGEYFSVPRGRVLLRRQTGQGVIYHGSSTSRERLAVIAVEFLLTDWRAALDHHYEVGHAANGLFDDDDW